jgi:ATP-dependent Clp protease ATP-binding subunit ClpA
LLRQVSEHNWQEAHAPCEEAIRKHLRPELVNRLTKIVHFNTLGMDAAREIVGKLLTQLNARVSDRGVTVELDERAVELILREGYSPEYGARNLERVMDRMLGGPIGRLV